MGNGLIRRLTAAADAVAARRAPDRRFRGRSTGQALVELAIILPVFLVLTMAAVDLGRIFFAQITIANAAREGAYEAAYGGSYNPGTDCDSSNTVMCAILNEAQGSLTIAPTDVVKTCSPVGGCAAGAYGEAVTLKVTGHFDLLTPILSVFFGGTNITFSSTATADMIDTESVRIAAGPTPTAVPTVLPTPPPDPTASPFPTPSGVAEASPTPSAPLCSPPNANFTYTVQQKKITFTSTSTPTTGTCQIAFWRWDYGDGVTDAGNFSNATHQYPNNNRSYTVILTVTNPYGSVSVSAIVTTG
jgi:Flp pilus assembly protein TadG